MENQSAESLHEKGKSNKQVVGPGFVNAGTPASPLTSMADKPNPEVSPSGSAKLREGLTKR